MMTSKDQIPTYDQAISALDNRDREVLSRALFAFDIDDASYIERVKEVVRDLLIRPNLTPKQIMGIGRALHGIGRLPFRTPGLDIQISLSIKDDGGAEEYDFYLDEERFLTTSGGYISFGYGSDSFSGATFEVYPGSREYSGSIFGANNWPDGFSGMAAGELTVVDLSNDTLLDWEHPDGSEFWEWIANHE